MAYPFTQLPTFAEFINRVTSEFDGDFETLPEHMIEKDDETSSISFLKREVDGVRHNYVIFVEDFDARMSPTVLRSICSRLKLNPKDFNLNLG